MQDNEIITLLVKVAITMQFVNTTEPEIHVRQYLAEHTDEAIANDITGHNTLARDILIPYIVAFREQYKPKCPQIEETEEETSKLTLFQELVAYLTPISSELTEDGKPDLYDIYEAIYWYAVENHTGQDTDLYEVSSAVLEHYTPAPCSSGLNEEAYNARNLYAEIDEYLSK